jgi:hypothetical protein
MLQETEYDGEAPVYLCLSKELLSCHSTSKQQATHNADQAATNTLPSTCKRSSILRLGRLAMMQYSHTMYSTCLYKWVLERIHHTHCTMTESLMLLSQVVASAAPIPMHPLVLLEQPQQSHRHTHLHQSRYDPVLLFLLSRTR